MGLFFQLLLVVLGQLTGLLHGLELIHGVAADVTDGDLGLLALLLDLLGQLLAALLGGCGKDQADDLAVIDGVNADVAGLEGLGDGLEHLTVPGSDGQDAGLGHSHSGDLVDGRGAAVVVHGDLVQDGGVGAAGADGGQLVDQVVDAGAHFLFIGFGSTAHR